MVRNDGATWDELSRWEFDNIVISPGPGRPDHEKDFGVCGDAILRAHAPLLGVCLGHQGLGWIAGRAGGARARGNARAPERSAPRGVAAVRRDPARVPGGPLPLAVHLAAASGGPGADRVDQRRGDHGRGASPPAALGGPVPSRVDLHRLRPEAARQLPRPHRRRPAGWDPGLRTGPRCRQVVAAGVAARAARAAASWRSGGSIASTTPSVPSSICYGDAASTPSGWTAADSTSAPASPSWAPAGGPLEPVVAYDWPRRRCGSSAAAGPEVHQETIFELPRPGDAPAALPLGQPAVRLQLRLRRLLRVRAQGGLRGRRRTEAPTPDAAFVFADRLIVVRPRRAGDLRRCASRIPSCEADGQRWVRETSSRLAALPPIEDPDWEQLRRRTGSRSSSA